MREEKFKEAKVLFDKSGALLLSWATGLGKTFASLRLIDESKKVVVLCQELTHIENWKKELQKHGLELDIEFYTYASMHKVEGSGYDLILDESHWCTSDLRRSKLSKLNYDRVVLLSASMEDSEIALVREVIPELVIHSVELQEAIDGGVLPEPDIQVVELELDTKIKQHIHYAKRGKDNYKIFTCGYGGYFKTLKKAREHKSYIVVCSCTEKQKYLLLKGEADAVKRRAFKVESLWQVYKYKVLAIKRFLAEIKTSRARLLMKMLESKGKRHIVFTNSIAQAKQLGEVSIHSENSSKKNQSIIDDFNNKRTDNLVTVKMLRESLNLVDIQAGIIVQIDNKRKSPIQMIGRILRGKDPVIYLLTFINTLDDEYVRKNLHEKHTRVQSRFTFPT